MYTGLKFAFPSNLYKLDSLRKASNNFVFKIKIKSKGYFGGAMEKQKTNMTIKGREIADRLSSFIIRIECF